MKKSTAITPKAIIATTTQKAQDAVEKVQETAQNVWFAGLGALTMAEDQGGKLFKTLVKKGEVVDSKNKKVYGSMVKDVSARIEVVKESVVDATSGTINKIESGLESSMAGVLHTFGVPTRSEIKTLTRKVDALTESVNKKAKTAIRHSARKVRKVKAAAVSGTPSF